jgi:hypothetical protein
MRDAKLFGLLYDRLLDESLRLVVQVLHLGCRGRRHGPEQRHRCDKLLTRTRWRVWVIDIEVGIDALASLSAQLAHAFTARRGFSGN